MDSIVGLSWRSGHITSGPIYGKFCGKDWTNGQHDFTGNSEVDEALETDDVLDAACKDHDRRYQKHEYAKADRELAETLEALPEDPRMWPRKPPAHKIEEARRYRKWALWYFQGAVANRERPTREGREWGFDPEGRLP